MTQSTLGTLVPAATSGTQLADLLRNFEGALNTNHSGATRPAYVQTGMTWLDTSVNPWLLKLWTGTVDAVLSRIVPASGQITNTVLFGTTTFAQWANISTDGGGNAYFAHNFAYDSATVNYKNQQTNSIGWGAIRLFNGVPYFAGAAGATTSGAVVTASWQQMWHAGNLVPANLVGAASAINTSTGVQLVDFTGIPSDAKFVSINVGGVSLNGTDDILVQLGIGTGAFTTSGYAARSSYITLGPSATCESRPSPSGFSLIGGSASYQYYGSLLLTNMGNNTWVCSGNLAETAFGLNIHVAGNIVLSQALERVRLRAAGANNIDVNSGVSVTYWR